jgi:hypothetical protein
MKWFPLRWHSLKKGLCEDRAEVTHVLSTDAREVALLDIIENAFIGRWKPC